MNECNTCANIQIKNGCRTMNGKPRGKWCHQTLDQAIEAEKAIIEYANKHPGHTDKECKQNAQAQKWAMIHLSRLMSKEVMNV